MILCNHALKAWGRSKTEAEFFKYSFIEFQRINNVFRAQIKTQILISH